MSDRPQRQTTSRSSTSLDESDLLSDVIEIAERALWAPAEISPSEVQKIAAVIVAHVRRLGSHQLTPLG